MSCNRLAWDPKTAAWDFPTSLDAARELLSRNEGQWHQGLPTFEEHPFRALLGPEARVLLGYDYGVTDRTREQCLNQCVMVAGGLHDRFIMWYRPWYDLDMMRSEFWCSWVGGFYFELQGYKPPCWFSGTPVQVLVLVSVFTASVLGVTLLLTYRILAMLRARRQHMEVVSEKQLSYSQGM